MSEKKSLAEQVEERTTVNFGVSKCPQPIFINFRNFAEAVSKDAGLNFVSYPLALKELLDNASYNSIYERIFMILDEMEKRISKLEGSPEPNKKPKIPTFGGGE